MAIVARCMKCKTDKEMQDAQIVITKRGGFMAKGKCPDCGSGMCRIMSKVNAEAAVANGEAAKAY